MNTTLRINATCYIQRAITSALPGALFLCLFFTTTCSAGGVFGCPRQASDEERRAAYKAEKALKVRRGRSMAGAGAAAGEVVNSESESDSDDGEGHEETKREPRPARGEAEAAEVPGPVCIDLSGENFTTYGELRAHPDFGRAEVINLSGNRLRSLPAGLFAGCDKLRMLVMQNTGLERIDAGALRGAGALRDVDFSNNNLRELPEGLFASAPQLRGVDLEGNKIVSLPDRIFEHNTALRGVNLSGNPLRVMPVSLVARLGELQTLLLSDTHLPADVGEVLTARFVSELELDETGAVARGATQILTLPPSMLEGDGVDFPAFAARAETVGRALNVTTDDHLFFLPNKYAGYGIAGLHITHGPIRRTFCPIRGMCAMLVVGDVGLVSRSFILKQFRIFVRDKKARRQLLCYLFYNSFGVVGDSKTYRNREDTRDVEYGAVGLIAAGVFGGPAVWCAGGAMLLGKIVHAQTSNEGFEDPIFTDESELLEVASSAFTEQLPTIQEGLSNYIAGIKPLVQALVAKGRDDLLQQLLVAFFSAYNERSFIARWGKDWWDSNSTYYATVPGILCGAAVSLGMVESVIRFLTTPSFDPLEQQSVDGRKIYAMICADGSLEMRYALWRWAVQHNEMGLIKTLLKDRVGLNPHVCSESGIDMVRCLADDTADKVFVEEVLALLKARGYVPTPEEMAFVLASEGAGRDRVMRVFCDWSGEIAAAFGGAGLRVLALWAIRTRRPRTLKRIVNLEAFDPSVVDSEGRTVLFEVAALPVTVAQETDSDDQKKKAAEERAYAQEVMLTLLEGSGYVPTPEIMEQVLASDGGARHCIMQTFHGRRGEIVAAHHAEGLRILAIWAIQTQQVEVLRDLVG